VAADAELIAADVITASATWCRFAITDVAQQPITPPSRHPDLERLAGGGDRAQRVTSSETRRGREQSLVEQVDLGGGSTRAGPPS
jgi:hypothetical protein